jgi:hypothetical protein
MKVFHCDHCGHLLFFENTHCVRCGQLVAYLPDLAIVGSLDRNLVHGNDQSDDQNGDRENVRTSDLPDTWCSPLKAAAGRTYRLCRNYAQEQVCNWAVVAEESNSLCISCRLTRVIPDLDQSENRQAWYRLEVAKRRLIFTLLQLRLPIVSRDDDPERGLAFEFKGDALDTGPVLTGHATGVITINVAEADDAERERRRTSLHEPYRALAGHLRHESGHYYWDRLIADCGAFEGFREIVGDERADYGAALQIYYAEGAPADWQDRFISAYASAHPLEDWAETWTHYLHMVDTVETAAACGVSLQPRRSDEPSLRRMPTVAPEDTTFEQLIDSWFPVTYVLNELNRGLGLSDPYPFVWSAPAIDKLRFVHDIVRHART